MSAAAEIQSGKAEIYGIQNDGTAIAIVDTVNASAALASNLQSVGITEEWAEQELSSTDGAVVEGLIAARRRRKMKIKIIPNGATRAAALAFITALMAVGPNAVITTTHFKVAACNGTWNYKGGGTVEQTPEGYAVEDINLEQYETAAAAGTFAALALITG